MNYYEFWTRLDEISLGEMFKKMMEDPTLAACKKRHNAIDMVKITKLAWTPYKGMNTLLVRALAQSKQKDGSVHEYTPLVEFKKVQYVKDATYAPKYLPNIAVISAVMQQGGSPEPVAFYKLQRDKTDVLVRCQCEDYKWTFSSHNKAAGALFGGAYKKPKPQGLKPSPNPNKIEGMCKHILKLFKVLEKTGIFA